MTRRRGVPCIDTSEHLEIARVLAEGRPVVLRGLFDGEALQQIATVEGAVSRLAEMKLGVGHQYVGDDEPRERMAFRDYVAHVRREPTTTLRSTGYSAPAELLELFDLAALGRSDDVDDRRHLVFLAAQRTFAHLHWDFDQRGAILSQVFGRKLVLLIDPRESHKLDSMTDRLHHTSAHFLENLDEAELDGFIAFTNAQAVVLEPGDSLFVPAVFWHYVRYLELAMTVTHRLGRGRGNRRLTNLALPPTSDVQMLARELARAHAVGQDELPWLDALEAQADELAADPDRTSVLLAQCLRIREMLPIPDHGTGQTSASTREIIRRDLLRKSSRPCPFVIGPSTRVRLSPGVRIRNDDNHDFLLMRNGRIESELSGPRDDVLAGLLEGLDERRWRSISGLARDLSVDGESIAEMLVNLGEHGWLESAPAFDRAFERWTLGDVFRGHLRAAASALDLPCAAALEATLELTTASWKDRLLATPPYWSWMTADLTPIELSVNFDSDGVELRYAIEPHADPATPEAYWNAALALNTELAERYGANLARFDAVAHLFRPQSETPYIVAGHGVWVGRRPLPSFKIYAAPTARGKGTETATLHEACRILGVEGAWNTLTRSSQRTIEWSLVSIDLDNGPSARLKLYELLMQDPEAEVLRIAASVGSSATAFAALLRAIPPPVRQRWLVLYHSLSTRGYDHATLQIPIAPHADPVLVRSGVERLLLSLGISAAPYRRLLDATGAITVAPLAHTFVSIQMIGGRTRVTVYLAPRVYEGRYGTFDRAIWPSPVTDGALDA